LQVEGVQPQSAVPNAQKTMLAKLYNFHKSSDLSKGKGYLSVPQSSFEV